ncbi:peptidylprolyl isomerase [Denitrificimonas sp. JX-1]|uniref:Chaperone SurA n=1 Tax=Denitrificimonas halotolerans TaxID=3098930 RepID=A0ABU5GSE7_9GAMM|nr:peptidylprolyl isomerase [Denitrificimonas sp. JX-1]MDY7219906.1 peptidylprolyl isomerase [Denitrificimonas sp. JX-1]
MATVNVKTMLIKPLSALLLASSLLAGSLSAAEQPLDRVAAIVDNDIVMYSQYQTRLNEVQNSIRQRDIEPPPEDVLRQQVMERLILDAIQLQIAERSGIRVSDEELAEAMTEIAKSNGLTQREFEQALAADGLTLAAAKEQIRQEMIINRVRQYRVGERIQISEQEIQNFLASDLGKMHLAEEFKLANILIPLSDGATRAELAAAEQTVASIVEQLERGADFSQMAVTYSASENALDGGEMGWRQAAQLPPPFDRMLTDMSVGQVTPPTRTPGGIIMLKLLDRRGDSVVYRDEVNVRHILLQPSEIRSPEATRQLATRIYERLRNGENFAQLAKQFSDDPGSALNGGALNWVDPNALAPAFRAEMERTDIGQLSKPFESQFGWHVLEVLDRRSTDTSQQVRKQQAANLLRNRKYDEELQTWLRQIRDEAYVEIKTL